MFRMSSIRGSYIFSIISIAAMLSSCSLKMEPKNAIIYDSKKSVAIEIEMPREVAEEIVRKKFVVYIGLGGCASEAGDIYQSASLLGVSIPVADARAFTLRNPAVFRAEFEPDAVNETSCAFIKATSMYGGGGRSRAISLTKGS